MATLPTPEQTALEILSIFVTHFNSRPGNVIRYNNFIAVWAKRGLNFDDFKPGMEYAIEQSWIEVLPDGGSFRLTEIGFKQAPEGNEAIVEVSAAQTPTFQKWSWPKSFDTISETYEVVGKPLGEGGAGKVFPVKNGSNERFALKCLSPERITTERRKRFYNELTFCSRYEHRNIIQVLDSGLAIINETNCPFYVMPSFPMTLRTQLVQGITPSEVLPLFSQILDGIDAAHKLKAFHRDLKPENILYDPAKALIVVADFGIAHFEEDVIATLVQTKMNDRMANFGYAAPEQRAKGASVDHRADIFALGLMLNEMFTRVVPHGSGYKSIASVASEFAYLDLLVDSMIQNDPAARPDSIDSIKKELIARGNEFIALQRVDQKAREVVGAFDPEKVDPVKIEAADWDDGRLFLQLNYAPKPGWVQRFKQPSAGSWGSVGGAGPQAFQFMKATAHVEADERTAAQVLNYAKGYVEMANDGYQQDLDAQAKKQERAYREKLAQESAAAEVRARVLSKLKV